MENIYITVKQMMVTKNLMKHENFICFQIQMPVLPNMQVLDF